MEAVLVEKTFSIFVFREPGLAEDWRPEEYQVDSSGRSGADSVA